MNNSDDIVKEKEKELEDSGDTQSSIKVTSSERSWPHYWKLYLQNISFLIMVFAYYQVSIRT